MGSDLQSDILGRPGAQPEEEPVWPGAARWIHLGLLLSVTFQMVTGLAGWLLGVFPFAWHVRVGLFLVTILGLQWGWLWITLQGRRTLGYLFPWTPRGFSALAKDVVGLSRGVLAPPGPRPGLPGFMHGIFLLSVTLVALSGLTLLGEFRGWWSGVPMGTLLTTLRMGALAVAIQWLGHVGMVILHAIKGDSIWGIFSRRGRTSS
ncbi:cytochrome b/b6 domain-containing protein [Acidithiobacillus sp. AMEEHan]|uniref:cytochrome b/b6 domain-containing protein n=1 Tax=Acidithiobacillus sp. AMEEHan TaxID=2994951 RepID=UPI0035B4CBC1